MKRFESLLRFLYDFIVGDDWRIAIGTVLAIAATALVADTDGGSCRSRWARCSRTPCGALRGRADRREHHVSVHYVCALSRALSVLIRGTNRGQCSGFDCFSLFGRKSSMPIRGWRQKPRIS